MDGWVPVVARDILVERTPAFWTVGFRLLSGCFPDGARDVLVERTPAFWTVGFRSVPETSWLNGPWRFGRLGVGCFPDGARIVLVERTPALWTVGFRSGPEVPVGARDAWLNRAQRSARLDSGRCTRRPG